MTQDNSKKITPMMRQWQDCKEKAKDCLLLFRMGDFYEAFHEDAAVLAKALELTLTKRQDIPMSGIPYHAFNNYIDRLLSQGLHVAVAEQIEDPKEAIGLVKRDVVRVITPGTLIDSNLLEAHSHNYVLSLYSYHKKYGIALIDVTTCDFKVFESEDLNLIIEEIFRIKPSEIVISQKQKGFFKDHLENFKQQFKSSVTLLEDWHFDYAISHENLKEHFNVQSLEGYGLKGFEVSICASGALHSYLSERLCLDLSHIKTLKKIDLSDYLLLDHITLQHLEILEPLNSQNQSQTLFSHLNFSKTAMGARLLKEWTLKPLLNLKKIHQRQNSIETLLNDPFSLKEIRSHLSHIQDLERLIMKISTSYATAKDLTALNNSLKILPNLKSELKVFKDQYLQNIYSDLNTLDVLTEKIDSALEIDPPLKLGDGQTFKSGYNSKLDEYLSLSSDSKGWIARYQARLKEELEIKTLKVGYNRVFGYYIEVSKGQAHLMPQTFHRRQTLANNERFISDELKTYETKVLQAEDKISTIEKELFEELKEFVLNYNDQINSIAKLVAQLDSVHALSVLAQKYSYTKPQVNQSNEIDINQGKHPILSKLSNFIANSTSLNSHSERLKLITGPNMAGKSTYIRQVALIVILAQMGSYVPAKSATIGIIEKIFSRIGASDNLAKGQSTFMVEMVETANILNNLTDRSLVILDEIGRGTSTYDGIAIAQSTAEYILKTKAKTLFATHYFELTEMEKDHHGVINYTVKVHESDQKVTFLYKIVKGFTDQSYGIHVAELAGLPKSLIENAKSILGKLEKNHTQPKKEKTKQLSMFLETKNQALEKLKEIDINHLTPLEALKTLEELKNLSLIK